MIQYSGDALTLTVKPDGSAELLADDGSGERLFLIGQYTHIQLDSRETPPVSVAALDAWMKEQADPTGVSLRNTVDLNYTPTPHAPPVVVEALFRRM